MKILVVEDDLPIRDLIDINLTMAGYEVEVAGDGEEAKNKFDEGGIDLVLLDVMLPKIDGFTLIEHIKKKEVPVIFLTAKDSVLDKVKGLRLGGDDYITKPFESIELIARIESVARRYNKNDNMFKINNLEINMDQRKVFLEGKEIELTLKEFDLLNLFIQNKNIALSREQILDKVWGFDYVGETRTIDMHVQRLREKLKLKDNIKTVFKIGYRFEA